MLRRRSLSTPSYSSPCKPSQTSRRWYSKHFPCAFFACTVSTYPKRMPNKARSCWVLPNTLDDQASRSICHPTNKPNRRELLAHIFNSLSTCRSSSQQQRNHRKALACTHHPLCIQPPINHTTPTKPHRHGNCLAQHHH